MPLKLHHTLTHYSWGIQSQCVSQQVLQDSLENSFLIQIVIFSIALNVVSGDFRNLSFNGSHIRLHVSDSVTILHTVAPLTVELTEDCD